MTVSWRESLQEAETLDSVGKLKIIGDIDCSRHLLLKLQNELLKVKANTADISFIEIMWRSPIGVET